MESDLVWYCSYGSNLSAARLGAYLKGGKTEGASHEHEGCRDPSSPRQVRLWRIPHRMFFRAYSEWWQGLVCGIDLLPHDVDHTYVRLYLISRQQFYDIMLQENSLPIAQSDVEVDWHALEKNGSLSVLPESKYGHLMLLGQVDGYPVLTFTHGPELQEKLVNRKIKARRTASKAYLKVIVNGLLEAGVDKAQVQSYLLSREGITWTEDAFATLLRDCNVNVNCNEKNE